MKKCFLSLMSAVMLLLASCTQDDLSNLPLGQEMNTKVSMQLPTMQRAGHADPAVNNMRVFLIVSHESEVVDVQTATATSNTVNFDVRLVTGQSYDLAAWADFGDTYYTVVADPETPTVAPSVSMVTPENGVVVGSNNKRDAYFDILKDQVLTDNKGINMTLKRPFGLVKIVANDYDEDAVKNAGLLPTAYETTITMPTTLSLVDGAASNNQAVTIAAPTADVENSGELSYDYIFASANKELINFTMDYKKDGADLLSYTFNDIPLQRNYKTNISGNILTKQGSVTVTIDPIWDGTYTNQMDVPASELGDLLEGLSTEGEQHYIFNLSSDITGGDSFTLPALNESSSITINMQNVAGDRKVTFVGDEDFKGTINLTNTAASLDEAVQLTITVPQGDATIGKGYWNILSATTRPSTLRIEGGANVDEIHVEGGNVNVYKGANVGSVDRTETNNDESTVVTVFEDATQPTLGEGVTSKDGKVGIVNITTGKDYGTIYDAVVNAKENEVIEIAEGEYPYLPGVVKAKYLWTLPITTNGLTIRGKGNVVLYGGLDLDIWGSTNMDYSIAPIMIQAKNVTLENLTIKTQAVRYRGETDYVNKTIELATDVPSLSSNTSVDGFRMINCTLQGPDEDPLPDYPKNDGCLYLGHDKTAVKDVEIVGCKFINTNVVVRTTTEATLSNCVFEGIREYPGMNNALAVRGKATVENCKFQGEIPEEYKSNVVTVAGDGFVRLNNSTSTIDGTYYALTDNAVICVNGVYTVATPVGFLNAQEVASEGSTILLMPGDYDFTRQGDGTNYIGSGFVLTKKGLKIKAFDAANKPVIYASSTAGNGTNWNINGQNTVTISADNVLLDGLVLMPSQGIEGNSNQYNKALEVTQEATSFTMTNCEVVPNTKIAGNNAENYGGQVSINTSKNSSKNTVKIMNNIFTGAILDPRTAITCTGNTFEGMSPAHKVLCRFRKQYDGAANTQVYSDIEMSGNTYNNAANLDDRGVLYIEGELVGIEEGLAEEFDIVNKTTVQEGTYYFYNLK